MMPKENEHLQKLIDAAEDIALGNIAKKSYESSSDKDYINIEDLDK